jgi:hypothetical protein
MEHAHIMNDGRSISEEGIWRNPRGEEKPRTTNEKMDRHTGVNRSSAYKNIRREEDEEFGLSLGMPQRHVGEWSTPSCWTLALGVGSRAGMDILENRKILCLCQELNPYIIQSIA